MLHRRLGRTGLNVSQLSLGTVELGLDYGFTAGRGASKPDPTQAVALLNEALEAGINLFDTARAYGDAETLLGRALGHRRREIVIVSKVAACPGRPDDVRRSVEESLRALGTGHIDVMMIHCRYNAPPDADTAEVLLRCRDAGMIGAVGASVYGEGPALDAIRSGWCDCIEVAYSALDRRPEATVLHQAARADVGVLARSVLLRGALTSRCSLLPAPFAPLNHAVAALAQAAKVPMEDLPELAYRYVLGPTPPHSALVGTAHRDELRNCIAYALRGPLAPAEVEAVRALPMLHESWLNPGLWPKEDHALC
jgi:1-deoxyxylulose-5-phosphate synthase